MHLVDPAAVSAAPLATGGSGLEGVADPVAVAGAGGGAADPAIAPHAADPGDQAAISHDPLAPLIGAGPVTDPAIVAQQQNPLEALVDAHGPLADLLAAAPDARIIVSVTVLTMGAAALIAPKAAAGLTHGWRSRTSA